jgi:hypothetical protein
MRGLAMNTKLLELSIDERVELVEDLWNSIAAEQELLRLTMEEPHITISSSRRPGSLRFFQASVAGAD